VEFFLLEVSNAEISDYEGIARGIPEYILGLKVPMPDSLEVCGLDAAQDLSKKGQNLYVRDACFHEVAKRGRVVGHNIEGAILAFDRQDSLVQNCNYVLVIVFGAET